MTFRRPPTQKRREREPDEFASVVLARTPARMATGMDKSKPVAVDKDQPEYSEAWRRAVASLPECVLCGSASGNQAAHRNEGKGLGTKVDDCLTAALCVDCHSEIDQGTAMTREERRRSMDTAIMRTLVLLFRAGKVRVA